MMRPPAAASVLLLATLSVGLLRAQQQEPAKPTGTM